MCVFDAKQVCDQPHPVLVHDILNHCCNGELSAAVAKLTVRAPQLGVPPAPQLEVPSRVHMKPHWCLSQLLAAWVFFRMEPKIRAVSNGCLEDNELHNRTLRNRFFVGVYRF